MKVSDITSHLEALAPTPLQESYDNAGLITGRADQEVTGVILCLDSTEEVLEEAIKRGCNMIVAHHPIVFSGLKRFNGNSYVERVIIKALKNDLAIYAIHTNLDNVRKGVNEEIADRLGLIDRKILIPKKGQLTKIEVYVPEAAIESVRAAMWEVGAGKVGHYDQCSFRSHGTGSFRPLDGANPETGAIGELSNEKEIKLEMLLPSYLSGSVTKAMKKAHPYEEVAHQLIALENTHQEIGAGIIGVLENEMDSKVFLNHLKSAMEVGCVRYTRPISKTVKKVAVLGGSGSFGIHPARAAGADVLVTADVKYHEFFDADGKLMIADIGHYESEHFTSVLLQRILTEKFPTFAVLLTEQNTNPVNYL